MRCHASDIATKKAANEVQLMAYNLRLKVRLWVGQFCDWSSVRFNMFGVRVIKQGTVPCKLLIAANEIAVFVGCNITDAIPGHQIFSKRHTSAPSGKQHRPAFMKALI